MEQDDFFDSLNLFAESEKAQTEAAAGADQPDHARTSDTQSPAKEKKAPEQSEMNFEEAVLALEKVVEELQKSNLSLDKSMELFQRGTALLSFCRRHLDEAEQEVKILLEKASGETAEEDFLTEEEV